MNELFAVQQVARILGLHPKTIYAYVERGEMPHYKIGGRIRFDPAQVMKWLQAREVEYNARRVRRILASEVM